MRTIAASWPPGAYQAHAEAHRDFWLSDGRSKLDWHRIWEHRIISIGAKPLSDAASSMKRVAAAKVTAPSEPLAFDKPNEDPAVIEWRTAAAVTVGASVYRRLLDDARLVLDEAQLTIEVANPIIEQQLDASHLFRLEPLTQRILGRRLTRLRICQTEPLT